ncbi:hypothetical protein B0H16DRAFT_1463217 [Mycena metata]|uniref:Uncharacterized protein n=1 Tax=Mycena metata TaxID=1033252 RepID=A0AAD7IJ77_9AGAR|nr:hypothetical protein B0H16DRAFT_1463217 [Mycena metata]
MQEICNEFHTKVLWTLEDYEEVPLPMPHYDTVAIVDKELPEAEDIRKRERVEMLNARICCWLKYRVRRLRKHLQTCLYLRKDPYAILLAQLSNVHAPPKARQAYQQFMVEEYHPTIAPVVHQRWVQETGQGSNLQPAKSPDASFRAQVTRELFAALSPQEQEAYSVKAKEEAATAHAKYQEEFMKAPSKSPESRQECINRLGDFLAPILQGIEERTGLHSMVLFGGPQPNMGGELQALYVSYGRAKGMGHFPDWAGGRWERVLELMTEYCWDAFNSAASDSGSDSEMDSNCDSDDTDAGAKKARKERHAAKKAAPTARKATPAAKGVLTSKGVSTSKKPTVAGKGKGKAKSAGGRREGRRGEEGEEISDADADEWEDEDEDMDEDKEDKNDNEQEEGEGMAARKRKRKKGQEEGSASKRKHREAAGATLMQKSGQLAAGAASGAAPGASDVGAGGDGNGEEEGGGSGIDIDQPETPTPSADDRAAAAVTVQPLSASTLMVMGPAPITGEPLHGADVGAPPPSSTTLHTLQLPPPPRTGDKEVPPSVEVVVPSDAPTWLQELIKNLSEVDLGCYFVSVLAALIRLEVVAGFEVADGERQRMPSTKKSGHPTVISTWIKGGRGAKTKTMPAVDNIDKFVKEWDFWWDAVQPGRRQRGDDRRWNIDDVYRKEWGALDCSGANRCLSAVVGLYFWGVAVKAAGSATQVARWDHAVQDVVWVLEGLRLLYK